ncbi:UNVERIFIED_CONTAM: hypothetical protein Sradi_2749600 [Sesamum radiatum]|uniref:Uncharacterized protein n=1 Tax=Sesamum radiatum TaxID=300843 RepID=A0AAW2S883_SESRA
MASGAGKSAAFALLVLNIILYFIIIAIAAWAVNHGIERSHETAATSSLISWLLTMLAMGFACKEIDIGWTESNLRTLETILILVSGTQLFCTAAIYIGVDDAVARDRTYI